MQLIQHSTTDREFFVVLTRRRRTHKALVREGAGGLRGLQLAIPLSLRNSEKRTEGEIDKLLHLAPPESNF